MPNLNRVMMMGHLTRDVQLSFLPSNTAAAEFGLAISHKWKGADGNKKEEVCFIDCTAFGVRAENINKYFKKGDPIFVEGRLKFEQWEKDGLKRSKHKIIVESFTFVGSKKTEEPSQEQPAEEAVLPQTEDDDLPF